MRRVGDGRYVESTWDEAIGDIAARMNVLIDADGPDAIGAYYGHRRRRPAQLVSDADLGDLALRCDIPRTQIEQVAREFAAARGAMVVTPAGVSLHLADTVAEWLGHVLNVITGRMDRPGGRRYEPGYVDAIRLSGMVKASPHRSRLLGREMVAGAHSISV